MNKLQISWTSQVVLEGDFDTQNLKMRVLEEATNEDSED